MILISDFDLGFGTDEKVLLQGINIYKKKIHVCEKHLQLGLQKVHNLKKNRLQTVTAATTNWFNFSLSSPKFNSLRNDKFFKKTNFKAFADDKANVANMMIFVFDRVENIVGKEENAGYPHFLLFSQKATSSGSLKVSYKQSL